MKFATHASSHGDFNRALKIFEHDVMQHVVEMVPKSHFSVPSVLSLDCIPSQSFICSWLWSLGQNGSEPKGSAEN